MNAETFNRLYPVGTPVFAYPGFRPEDASDARRLVTRTRTKAQTSASGDPVVWVEGEGAYICLTHVDPVSEPVFEAAREADALAAAKTSAAKSKAAVNPRLADAIAAKGIPLSADLVASEPKPERQYPICPRPVDDPRFTFGLALDVAQVLHKHGYPRVTAGRDFLELQQALFGFIYVGPDEGVAS